MLYEDSCGSAAGCLDFFFVFFEGPIVIPTFSGPWHQLRILPVASNSDRFPFLGLWSLFESFQRMQQQIPDCVSHFDACRITNANLMLGSRVFCIPSNYIKQNSLCKNLSARPLGQRHRDAEKHSGWFATRVTPTCLRIYQSGSPKSRILRALESRAPEISRCVCNQKHQKQHIFWHDNHWYHRLSISIFSFVFVFVYLFLYLCL